MPTIIVLGIPAVLCFLDPETEENGDDEAIQGKCPERHRDCHTFSLRVSREFPGTVNCPGKTEFFLYGIKISHA